MDIAETFTQAFAPPHPAGRPFLLGGVAAGVWPDVHAGVAATVRTHELVEPVPEWVEVYRQGAPRYRALYPALRQLG